MDRNDTLDVVFLILLPSKPVATPKIPALSPVQPWQRSIHNARSLRDDAAMEMQRVASSVAVAPTQVLLVQGDDSWDLSSNPQGDELTFEHDPLRAAPNPLGPTRAERFRMRRQHSTQDVVRGLSQLLGFWPPGYTDNPCGGLRRSVEILSMATDDASRVQLTDALEAEARYCQ